MGRPRSEAPALGDGESRVERVGPGPRFRHDFHGPAADLVREASAMGCLLKAGVDTPEPVQAVRRRARELWERAITQGVAPTRQELDALWEQVPASDLRWAHRIVDSLTSAARERGTIATPQVIELHPKDAA